ncbi:MAG TPA: M48 family metalloprotease, partial [Desulfurivibrionaceae bacterium]|nr:M48 family metalloprotease [Desulfurivibrionaceae bacterium]
DGLNLNFKVYLSKEINAFAMADGTVRVYSGLLDAMPDDQVLAVIGHEIAHVGLKHSYQQMRQALLTDVAFKAVGSLGETVGELTASQLGQLGQVAVNAQFSQGDELEADAWAVQLLKSQGHDPYAMKRAIETLRDQFGSGGGFLSTHPANDKRIANIQAAIERS